MILMYIDVPYLVPLDPSDPKIGISDVWLNPPLGYPQLRYKRIPLVRSLLKLSLGPLSSKLEELVVATCLKSYQHISRGTRKINMG
jgi:hypothetical protein